MSRTEKQVRAIHMHLLDNALMALDRLFDRESSTLEVHALFYATAEALLNTEHHAAFKDVVPALHDLVCSGRPRDEERDKALWITDDLRHYLAEALR